MDFGVAEGVAERHTSATNWSNFTLKVVKFPFFYNIYKKLN